MKLHVSSSPHIHDKKTTQGIMLDVLIALLPAAVVGIYIFGFGSGLVLVVSVLSAVLAEAAIQRIMKKTVTVSDLSAAVTGLLIGLSMPPSVPLWIAAIGSVFAIVIVKQLFGGLGHNFVNPALIARAVLLTSWPVQMNTYLQPFSVNAVSSATTLNALKGVTVTPSVQDLFWGNIPGSIGEVCKLAILLGGAYLLIRKVITWHIPVSYLATAGLLLWLFGLDGSYNGDVLYQLLSGAILFTAFFMATDYTTSPISSTGKIIYGIGCGLIVAIIRRFGLFPEGATYAILVMNIITPLINKYIRPKRFGEVRANA